MARTDQPHKLTFDAFVAKASDMSNPVNAKHGSTDYSRPESRTAWNGSKSKIPLWCRMHREFYVQLPANHMNGHGCPKCGVELRTEKKRRKTPRPVPIARVKNETCTFADCGRPHKARGYCQGHYMQFKRGAPLEPLQTRSMEQPEHCQAEEGCSLPAKTKGLCPTHYARRLRRGYTRYHDRKREPKTCSVASCTDIYYAKGVCHSHYIKHRTWKHHGIDAHVYAEMLAAQGGVCALCGGVETVANGLRGKIRDLSIDHCHETNKVRSLLCSGCNTALGLLKDDPDLMRKAAAYVEEYRLKHDGEDIL